MNSTKIFFSIKQKRGQNLLSYIDEIESHSWNDKIPNSIKMYHFISGLNDILKDFVISKTPETFEKAMNMAVLKDNLLKQSNLQSINNLTEPEVSKNGENVKWENILSQVLSQKDQSIDNSANERLLAIERKLENLSLSQMYK